MVTTTAMVVVTEVVLVEERERPRFCLGGARMRMLPLPSQPRCEDFQGSVQLMAGW